MSIRGGTNVAYIKYGYWAVRQGYSKKLEYQCPKEGHGKK